MRKKNIIISDGTNEYNSYLRLVKLIQPSVLKMKEDFDDAVEGNEPFNQQWYAKLIQGYGLGEIRSMHHEIILEAHIAERQLRQQYYSNLISNLERSIYEVQRMMHPADIIKDTINFPDKFKNPKDWPIDEEGIFIIDEELNPLDFQVFATDDLTKDVIGEYNKIIGSFNKIHDLLHEKGSAISYLGLIKTLKVSLIEDSLSIDNEDVFEYIKKLR